MHREPELAEGVPFGSLGGSLLPEPADGTARAANDMSTYQAVIRLIRIDHQDAGEARKIAGIQAIDKIFEAGLAGIVGAPGAEKPPAVFSIADDLLNNLERLGIFKPRRIDKDRTRRNVANLFIGEDSLSENLGGLVDSCDGAAGDPQAGIRKGPSPGESHEAGNKNLLRRRVDVHRVSRLMTEPRRSNSAGHP